MSDVTEQNWRPDDVQKEMVRCFALTGCRSARVQNALPWLVQHSFVSIQTFNILSMVCLQVALDKHMCTLSIQSGELETFHFAIY